MKKLFTLLTMLMAVTLAGHAATYLVVGQSAIANGEYWNNAAEGNVMTTTDEGETYQLELKDANLSAGAYEYKIVEKGSWDEYYPKTGSNASFSVAEDGVYDITYVFTVSTSQCVVTTTKTSSEIPNATISKVQICGATDSEWQNKVNVDLELQEGKYIGTLTLADQSLDYEFKLVINEGTWLGSNNFTLNDASSLTKAKGGNGSNLILNNSTSDYKTYTFTATWEENPNEAANWTLTIAGDENRVLTYSVVGDEGLTGFNWDYTETSTAMVEDEGVYSWSREAIYLDGNNYAFRVAKYYRSSTQWPTDNNWVINTTIDEYDGAGYYDVTITFEPANENHIGVSVKKHNTTYAVTFVNKQGWEKVYVWAWNEDKSGFNMTWTDESHGVELEKTGTEDTFDVYTYSFTNHTGAKPVGILFNNNGDAQTSDFAYTPNEKYAPVTSVAITMAKDFETFSSAYALDFSATTIKAYRATISEGKVVLTKVGKVPAKTGVLLQKNGAEGEVEVPTTFAVGEFGENKFVATDGTSDIEASTVGKYNYVLQTNNGVQGFYNVNAKIAAPAAGKAYLQTSTELTSEAGARTAWIFADGETTGINTVREAVNNGRFYNLAGQRVATPTKGLYIVNGKKVIVK